MGANLDHLQTGVDRTVSLPTPRESAHPVVANPPPDLHEASARGDVGLAHWALVCGADPSRENARGFGPLHLAATAGHVEVCRALLAHGARVNQRSTHAGACAGCTPLHAAVAGGHAPVVELLLSSGASPDLRDEAGFTALHTASLAGHHGLVKRLLLAGAHPEAYVAEHTPLDLAWRGGHGSVVGLLRQVTRRGR